MEEKIDKIFEEIKSLKVQIQKLVIQNTVGEDQAFVTYLQNKNEIDFVDRECREALNDYIVFKDNLNPFLPNVSQLTFNRTIKKVFPNLMVSATTRRGKCVQYFKRK